MNRRTPRAAAALAVLLLPVLAGCGIRSTSVPVDAGPAPSRVSCAPPKATAAPAPDTVSRQIYLVCSMQLAPVARSVQVRDVANVRTSVGGQATELIRQLEQSPRAAESQAGFSTAVPASTEIAARHPGDPASALRLNQELEDLPSFALAQIVCTLTADSGISPDHSVLLGGQAAGDPLHSYTCTSDLRTRPDAGDDAGTLVRQP
ncbi:hypothetical protein SAMN05216267_1019151 [Actinacidiphila rubida]|uniref:Lipoprotein n=1 Tax=Actinacidiphila rubida TaxID=310780 RepID=A0A1H8MRC8_9ACTN|nr:GerMN domain-containing protein [Actinacidiphila rubida]SEO19810.1 hypothetical protein SAMN05216267_1019151 [Actinacidiphila rubida]